MSWKPRWLHLSLAIALLCCFENDVFAQATEAAEKPKPTVAGEQNKAEVATQASDEDPFGQMTLDEISKDFKVKMSAYMKRYRTAPTKTEKRIVFKSLPTVEPYWPRFAVLVREANGSDDGMEVIKWWYRRGGRKKGTNKISRLLVENCWQNEGFNEYAFMVKGALPSEEAEAAFKSVREKTSLESVKATACYELHEVLRGRAEGLTGEAAEAVLKEALSLRELICTTYPAATDGAGAVYADLLASIEFAKKLEIGKPVPDIDGVDIDGKNFKLSDYDGQVRVISFWGDW